MAKKSKLKTPASVHRKLEQLTKPMVKFARDFCSIDTTNPPGRNYLACCKFLDAKLKSMGFASRIMKVPPAVQEKVLPGSSKHPRYNVVGLWDVGAKRTLHLTGHYDVVPATSGWKTDPFKPVLTGNRIIARGANDMKGSISAAIFAIQALQKARVTPPWNIEFSFTADEETGGELGLGYLAKAGKIAPDAAVLLEGAGGGTVGYAHRGVLWLDVTVIGKSGHACVPSFGINALELACGLIEELQVLKKRYAKRPTAFRMAKPSYKPPTLMIGGISGGGGKVNTIPDRFHFTIDRRLSPEEKFSEAKAEIMAVIRQAEKRNRKLKVRVKQLLHVPPGWTPLDAPICKIAASACQAVRGAKPTFRMTPGFTDMHWLTRDLKVPTVLYGCGGGGGAHADKEFTIIPEMIKGAKVLLEIAMRMPTDK